MRRNEAMKELNKELTKLNEFLRLWREVKRVNKKDGKDFVNLSKNFEGVRINRSSIDNRWVDLSVYAHVEGFGYISDEVTIYPNREEIEEVTADLVAKKIEEIINDREKQIQDIEEDIKMFDAINEELREAYSKAVAARKKAKSYKLRDLIDTNHEQSIYSMRYAFDNVDGLEYDLRVHN